jgi:hypothetical protein
VDALIRRIMNEAESIIRARLGGILQG